MIFRHRELTLCIVYDAIRVDVTFNILVGSRTGININHST